VNLQPLITSVNVSANVSSPPASADISLQIPDHLTDDFRLGRNLILTTMMEVHIYMKGYFLLNGAPQYYPVFWGIVTSVADNYGGGQNTVSLSCQDITYWWQVQHININPSILSVDRGQARRLSETGNVFTGMNAFQIMYTLSRQVHGDSVNVQQYLTDFQVLSEATATDNLRLTAYWEKKLGRITTALKMYGPTGRVIQGSLFANVVKPNTLDTVGDGKRGLATANESVKYNPDNLDFLQGGVDLSTVTPFSLVLSKLGQLDVWNGELMTKIQIAQQVAETIGYEFFQDMTGELIFKPPFYNLDVYGNFPVSWIRDIDLISDTITENIPEATYIEGTGLFVQNMETNMSAETQPRATYIDYRLVQKFGWKKAEINSQFIGSFVGNGQSQGGPQALFLHLVDQLDRSNARTHSGSVTIPLRPELRLGYPVYHESRDSYYYVESISHTFSYGSSCTTSLTLMAGRKRFYADFEGYDSEAKTEPAPGTYADPARIVRDLYTRPVDPRTGGPQGDRNVIFVYDPRIPNDGTLKTTQIKNQQLSRPDSLLKDDLVDLRSQFRPIGSAGAYRYQIDPARDTPFETSPYKKIIPGRTSLITQITSYKPPNVKENVVIFPISDERGYEVFGGYEYGRSAQVSSNAFTFNGDEIDKAARAITFYAPTADSTFPNLELPPDPLVFNSTQSVTKSPILQLSPNNYGLRLTEIVLPDLLDGGFAAFARGIAAREIQNDPSLQRNEYADDYRDISKRKTPKGSEVKVGSRVFTRRAQVERWLPAIRRIRQEEGLSERDFPDDLMLAFIHVESGGDPSAGEDRLTQSGKPTQFRGLLQMGTLAGQDSNIAELQNGTLPLQGNGELAIRAFFKVQKRYRSSTTNFDPIQTVILWSRGNRPLKNYRKALASGLSEEEALRAPDVAAHNVLVYQQKIRAARSIWSEVLGTTPQEQNQPSEELARQLRTDQENAQKEDDAGADVAKEDTIPEQADLDAQNRNQLILFERAVAKNLEGRVNTLPSEIIPPRDRSVIPILNDFLSKLYSRLQSEAQARQNKFSDRS
jgi:hypothetical protein